MNARTLALVALGLLAGPMAANAAILTANPVTYSTPDFDLTVSSIGQTDFVLAPGDAFAIQGWWGIQYNGQNYCPGCQTQFYLAGLAPFSAQVNLGQSNTGTSGGYFANLTAPATPGTYFIGGAYTWDYVFQTGVTGYANSSELVNYKITVEAPVPVPAAAWLMLSGLAGLGFLRRRKV